MSEAAKMIDFEIVPIAQNHIPGFYAMFDIVARERKFLSFLEAPSLEETTKFVLDNIETRNPQFVVLSGGKVVGWCDVLRNTKRVVFSHCGTLGIGLLPEFRGRGIGRQLMQTTIAAAWQRGITRIELTVREHNANAIALYKRLGFKIEGLHRNAVCINGQYQNVYAMALLNESPRIGCRL
jgi:ribosomal protein S18 acetylase RimI-like enzyme